ncbi:MAG: alpha/beta hydrolase, partial [Candidatus Latescibacteria bacterium]|nr:alpha/beta hydrolase [Candidatus Latescibacterota bacterium]
MPELAHEYQMLAVDLRGHGLSSNPDHGYNWADDFSEDVVALISHLGLKDVVLVGHSLGAMVAIPTAAKLPDVV